MAINRLKELNKLWFELNNLKETYIPENIPKKGDKVKFRIKGSRRIYAGDIVNDWKENDIPCYTIASNEAPSGEHDITIIECNDEKLDERES